MSGENWKFSGISLQYNNSIKWLYRTKVVRKSFRLVHWNVQGFCDIGKGLFVSVGQVKDINRWGINL